VVTLMNDVYALADAVDEAVAFAQKHPEETLIVVTGDHETGGLSIGYALTAYTVHMEYLQQQKLSYVAMDGLLKDLIAKQATFDEIMDVIKENYGLTREEGLPLSLGAQEVAQLSAAYTFGMLPSDLRKGVTGLEEQLHYGSYNPMSVTACHILANKAGINFSSFSHTGLSLPVYAMGAGSELFNGTYANTDIFVRFMKAMGLSE
jgi:alkaline phosphatase